MTKEKNNKLSILLLTIIVIGIITYIVFIRPNYYLFNGNKIFFEPIKAELFITDKSYQLYTYNNYIYFCTKDGLKKMTLDGNIIWDKVFNIEEPKLLTFNNYIAVANMRNKEVYLFDEDGFITEIKLDYPILVADMSSEGAIAVILEQTSGNLIQLYNRKGVLVAEKKTSYNTDGYPVSIDISSTGENMVISYLIVDGEKIKSIISILDFKDIENENILGAFILEDTIVPEVKFINDKKIVAVGDNTINIYNIKDIPILEKEIKISNQIEKIAFTKKSIVIKYGEIITPTKNNLEEQIYVYSDEGKVLDSYKLEGTINSIIGADRNYYLLKKDSIEKYSLNNLLWRAEVQKEVKEIMQIDKNKYLLVYPHGYEILKVKEI